MIEDDDDDDDIITQTMYKDRFIERLATTAQQHTMTDL